MRFVIKLKTANEAFLFQALSRLFSQRGRVILPIRVIGKQDQEGSDQKKKKRRVRPGFLELSSVKIPLQGARVGALVGELRSHMLQGVVKKRTKSACLQLGNGARTRGYQNLAAFSPFPSSLLPTDPQVVGDAGFLFSCSGLPHISFLP